MARQARRTKARRPQATQIKAALQLGDLVSAAFDQAYKVTKNQKEAAALASVVVQRLLARDGRDLYLKRLAAN